MVTDERGRALLDVQQTAERLGVRAETVYAYVSRGRLHPVPVAGERRSHFDPAEVDALARTSRRPRGTDRTPLEIETAVTALGPDGPRYRGRSAIELVDEATFEQVAEMLWTGELSPMVDPFELPDDQATAVRQTLAGLDDVDNGTVRLSDRLRLALVAATAVDPWRADLSPAAAVQAGRQRIAAMVAAIAPTGEGSIAERLTVALATAGDPADLAPLVDAALVLLADHELAGSTFATRIAASFGADVGGALLAGLGPMSGFRHGAASAQAEELIAGIERDGAGAAIGAWMGRHDRLPGFGHVVYTDGDARADALFSRLRAAFPASPALAAADALMSAAAARGVPPPNIDLALAVLMRVGACRPGSGEVVFSIARAAGLVAHSMEEYAAPSRLRPRARYVGSP